MADLPLAELAQQILQRDYGITGAQIGIQRGYMSDRAVVEACGRRWLLKLYGRGGTDSTALAEAHRLVRFLAERSFPTPAPIESLHGRTLVTCDARMCALFPFVDGQPFSPGSREQLAAAGRALAQLHALGAEFGFDPQHLPNAPIDGILEAKARELDAVRTHIDAALWSALDQALRAGDELQRGAGALPHTMVHGDFRAQNVLFDRDRVAAVLDFDAATVAPRLVDLAYALVFFQAVIAQPPLSRDQATVLLDAHEQVNPLTDPERALLPAAVRFSWMRGMLLWARIAYLDRASDKAQGWIEAYRDYPRQIESFDMSL